MRLEICTPFHYFYECNTNIQHLLLLRLLPLCCYCYRCFFFHDFYYNRRYSTKIINGYAIVLLVPLFCCDMCGFKFWLNCLLFVASSRDNSKLTEFIRSQITEMRRQFCTPFHDNSSRATSFF